MPHSEFYLDSVDGRAIPVTRWLCDDAASAVVLIAHGMGEHPGRYGELAASLNAHGYHTYAPTHRGHGQQARDDGTLGEFGDGGFKALVDDLLTLTREMAARHADLPIFLFGHSMGAFVAQLFIRDHSREIAGVALSGTAAPDLRYSRPGDDETRGGWQLADNNAGFEPARTPFDWLSRDPSQVDAYIADPLCGHTVSKRSLRSMQAAFEQANDLRELAGIRPDLPIYLFTGDQDPVNHNLAWFHPLVERYRQAGIREVSYHVYGGARHETLNETNRQEVTRNLLAWLDRVRYEATAA